MQTITQLILEHSERSVFTRQEAAFWSKADGAALDGLLKRAVRAGEILRYRRGLYGLSPRYARVRPHPFSLAQFLHGPSYISLECGLAHAGWIPEAVYAVTSVTTKRGRSFENSLGLFTYTRIPQERLFAGVRHETASDGGVFFIATPLKALADYVYTHRPAWDTLEAARNSLRIEESELETLDASMIDELNGVYRDKTVLRLLENIQKELVR